MVTSVLRPATFSACCAACCGVSGAFGMTGSLAWSPCPAGIRYLVTESELLCHSHAVVPLRIRSVSPNCTGAARRSFRGPSYQIFSVCDPASSDVIEFGFCAPGSCGMPSAAVSTTVPVSGGMVPRSPATAASSCAGVRGGSAGAACATVMAEAMPTPATTATTPVGTTQRLRRENLWIAAMKLTPRRAARASAAVCHRSPVIHSARRRCGIPVSKGHMANRGNGEPESCVCSW